MFTLRQVQVILDYGRFEGAPSSAEEIIRDLKRNGVWPETKEEKNGD